MTKPTRLPRPRLVEVTWTDSFTHDVGWAPASDYVDHISSLPFLIRTVGFLLYSDRHRVILSPSIDPHDKCSGTWVIPRGVILRIRRLK